MFSVLIALSTFVPQEQPKAAAVLEILPLQHLVATPTPVAPPPWGTLLRANLNGEQDGFDPLFAMREESWFTADDAAEMLNSLHVAAIEADHLSIRPHQDCLHVFGQPQAVQRVSQDVRELSGLLTRPIEIEVALWQAGDLTEVPAVAAPAEYSRLVANLTPLWRSVRTTHSNGVASHDRQRWVRYVRDVDTEVAQKSKIALPVTDAFCDGGRVVVCPHGLVSGDDLVLHVQFGFGVPRGPVRTVSSGLANSPDLDVPTLATIFGACSGRVQNGGALAVLCSGHAACGDRLLLTVRATASSPPADAQARALAVYPISALTSPALRQRSLPPSPYPLVGDNSADLVRIVESESAYGRLDADELQELLVTALGELAEAEGFALRHRGGFLFVQGERTTLTRVGDLLRGLEQRLLRNVQVQHHGDVLLADHARAPLHDLVAPTLIGRELTLARLLETTYVRELHAEIAQDASTLEPQVETAQSGTWLRLCLADTVGEMHLDMLAQTAVAQALPPRNVNPGGVLMPIAVASCRQLHDGKVVSGRPIDHGDGPVVTLDGAAQRTALSTTVKW